MTDYTKEQLRDLIKMLDGNEREFPYLGEWAVMFSYCSLAQQCLRLMEERDKNQYQQWSRGYAKAMEIYQANIHRLIMVLEVIGMAVNKENLPELDVHTRTFIEAKIKEATFGNI